MQNTQSAPADRHRPTIIDIAISVYQNLGITRWIEQPSIFQRVETYFEICEIIFPESSIDFYRIDRDEKLTVGQKIQGVISLISGLINNDLSHISGQEIARGRTNHIRNFLELLEALTSNMIKGSEGSVQSAREKNRPSGESQSNSYYTVMAINKEFEKIRYRPKEEEQEEGGEQNRSHREEEVIKAGGYLLKQQRDTSSKAEIESSSENDFPIKPIKPIRNKGSGRRPAKQQENRPSSINTHKGDKEQLNQLDAKYKHQNRQIVSLIKQIYISQQELQSKKKLDKQAQDIRQENQRQSKNKESLHRIEKEASTRIKAISTKMVDRNKMLQSLEGEITFSKNIKNIFRQEKHVRRQQVQRNQEREQRSIKELMNFDEFGELLKKAVNSNSLRAKMVKNK